MGLSTWKDKYRSQGAEWPLEDFVRVASDVLGLLGIDEASVPNERLVRYYTAEGAMSKPGRDGREARYTFQHLVEFLVTRMLLKDGWPLSKVSQFVMSSAPEALEQMLPAEHMTAAQRELRSIKRSMKRSALSDPDDASLIPLGASRSKRSPGPDDELPLSVGLAEIPFDPMQSFELSAPDASRSPPYSASEQMFSHQRAMSGSRSLLGKILHSTGFGKHQPEWKETASIDLTPWCTVTFDAEQLKALPTSAFDTLGEALAQSLREQRMAKRRERK
jgi:DNA-binding transcriptional MerR regulator